MASLGLSLFFLLSGLFKSKSQQFPGGAVVKNPPASAGDTGSIPGLGGLHVPWRN